MKVRAMFNAWLLPEALVCCSVWDHADKSNRLYCVSWLQAVDPPCWQSSRKPSVSFTPLLATWWATGADQEEVVDFHSKKAVKHETLGDVILCHAGHWGFCWSRRTSSILSSAGRKWSVHRWDLNTGWLQGGAAQPLTTLPTAAVCVCRGLETDWPPALRENLALGLLFLLEDSSSLP